ncbi:hypothetical protein ACWEQV_21010 [Rhodococcus aetherivorans]
MGIVIESGWQEMLWFLVMAPVGLLILFATWRITAWIEGDTNDEDARGSRREVTGQSDAAGYGIGGILTVGAAALLALWSWQAALLFIGLLVAIWFVAWVLARRFVNEKGQIIPYVSPRRKRADLAARADEQHALYLQGDRKGIYGQFMPADLDDGSNA